QHARERETLAHAGRERDHGVVSAAGEVHAGQRVVGAVDAEEARDDAEVLARGELFVEIVVMAEQGDVLADVVAVADEIESQDGGAAEVGPDRGSKRAEQRRLARAVAPRHREYAAGGKLKRNANQRPAAAVAAGEVLR